MRIKSVVSKSPKETTALAGEVLSEATRGFEGEGTLIFYLSGELGAGKTHFVKGLAEGLGIRENITSPTFVLMKRYTTAEPTQNNNAEQTRSTKGKTVFYHIDCYRIYDAEDARQIGLDKILKIPNAIIAIEWAERISEIIPKPYWEIKFEHISDNERRISAQKFT